MVTPIQHVVVVGMGRNARHNTYPTLCHLAQRQPLSVSAVVDLTSRADDVRAFCNAQALVPDEVILCPDDHATRSTLPACVEDALCRLLTSGRLDGLIISTDPREHMPYMLWAARHHVDVLVDKPISAAPIDPFAYDPASRLLDDYLAAVAAFASSRATATVMVTRRAHPGYDFVREQLTNFIAEWDIPLTYLRTSHANGYWNMPDEFYSRENHPYRYGYGALLHAGYHVIDLATWLLGVNRSHYDKQGPMRLQISTRHAEPSDFFAQVPAEFYERAFGDTGLDEVMARPAQALGEIDVSLLGQLRNRHGASLTQFSVDMLETALSRRAWLALPDDHYKGNGRTTHEEVVANCAHLLCLRTSDLRSGDDTNLPFQVRVFRNAQLIGGTPYEEITFQPAGVERAQGDTPSLADDGRRTLTASWLNRAGTRSPLDDHYLTVLMTVLAYRAMGGQRRGEPPVASAVVGEV